MRGRSSASRSTVASRVRPLGDRSADLRLGRVVTLEDPPGGGAALFLEEPLCPPERPGLGIDPDAEVEDERRARQRRFRLRLAALVRGCDHSERNSAAGRKRGCGADDYEHACAGTHPAPIILGAWRVTARFSRRSSPRAHELLSQEDGPILVDIRERSEWETGGSPMR